MFCSKCGTDMPEDSRFCRSCGQTQGVVSTGGGAAAAPARIPTPAPEPKSKSATWIVAGLVLLLVLGAVWYVQNTTSKPLPAAPQPQLHTQATGDKAFTVNAGAAYSYKFEVPAGAYNASLKGHFAATGGIGNDIEAFVITQDDYVNWQTGHAVHTLYNSGKVTQETLNVALPNDAGTYCLVFSNKGWLVPRAVQANVNLTYYTR